MSSLFHEPSRGVQRHKPTVREWALAHVQSNNVRLVNHTDSDESFVSLFNAGLNREFFSPNALKATVEQLYREGLLERGIPSVEHTSKTYTLKLTPDGKRAFREQSYRIGVTQGPTPTPNAFWTLLTGFIALLGLVLGISGWFSEWNKFLEFGATYAPHWADACHSLAVGTGATLLTWRIISSNRRKQQGRLLLMLAWIVPTSVGLYCLLLGLSWQIAPGDTLLPGF